ncbi:hypothetical protein FQN57_001667 [Myotisia sp. PD_48]|nr:hypothetical protein FQN57_001667 [Myotisia sp. PD_48]
MTADRSIWNGHMKLLTAWPVGLPCQKWAKEVPNAGLLRYYFILNEEKILVTSPKGMADVLVNKTYDYTKPPSTNAALEWATGHGILLAEGSAHKAQRKNLNPAFSHRHVKNLYPIFWQKGIEMAQKIEKEISESPADHTIVIKGWAEDVTLKIIAEAGLGCKLESLTEIQKHFRKVLARPSPLLRYFQLVTFTISSRLFYCLPLPFVVNIRAGSAKLKELSREILREKKRKMEEKKDVSVDIISVAQASGMFTEDAMIPQIMTFLLAGHETTATALQYAVHELCMRPDIQKRLREEVRNRIPSPRQQAEAVGDGGSSFASILDSIPYLSAFCNEILRFYPPVPLLWRQARCNTTINNYPIKKGTAVMLSPQATNHDHGLWGPTADVFDPDRWLGPGRANSGGAESNYAFLTFTHGPRSCIASGFAKSELMCLVAVLVGIFEMELEDPDKEFEVIMAATLKPKDGVRAKLRPLDGW